MKKSFTSLLVLAFALPLIVGAQVVDAPSYNTLIDSGLGEKSTFSDYLNSLYVIAISVAALLAVVKIIIAGVKYMLSDVVTSKEDAKKDIKTSILGLIIIVSAVLILTVINPSLTDFSLEFRKPDPAIDTINQIKGSEADYIKEELGEETAKNWKGGVPDVKPVAPGEWKGVFTFKQVGYKKLGIYDGKDGSYYVYSLNVKSYANRPDKKNSEQDGFRRSCKEDQGGTLLVTGSVLTLCGEKISS